MASLNEAAHQPPEVRALGLHVSAWLRTRVLATGASVVLASLVVARLGASFEAVLAAALVVVLVILAAIDVERRVLPNRIVLPSIAVALGLELALRPAALPLRLAAAFGAAAFFLAPSLVRPGAVGMGDVKLAFLLGLALGGHVVGALALGLLAAAGAGVVYVVRDGRRELERTIPLGPFLAFGSIIAVVAGGVQF